MKPGRREKLSMGAARGIEGGQRVSEEISSGVAECTRLILVKDGFGGDLRALDRLRMKAGKTRGF
jgi:hypothetical protein